MRWIFSFFLLAHGLINLMGALAALCLIDLPQLGTPGSRSIGFVWLAAAALTFTALVTLFTAPRRWWRFAAAAAVASQVAIISAWPDAKFGTVANVIVLLGALHGYLTQGPRSFSAQFERASHPTHSPAPATPLVTDSDLAHLPEPVRRYVRLCGAVGQPRVNSYRVRFKGRIRAGPDARWMPFVTDQQSFVVPPTRLFLMHARMAGLPVEAYHRLVDGHATMRVRALGAITIVDASGEVMDQSEAVTLFNDMCILAPATLIGPTISWQPLTTHSAGARFTNGSHTISATLHFDDEGHLVDFVSDDRSRASKDGKSFTRLRFSTPVGDYRVFGARRLAAHGEARWHLPDGAFTYGEFDVLSISYNDRA